jgi:hypothetical protein
MKKKYSNSLDNVMTKYKDRVNNVNIIDKEDIIAMFSSEKPKKKDKFRILK